jgi:hypothetical protein
LDFALDGAMEDYPGVLDAIQAKVDAKGQSLQS